MVAYWINRPTDQPVLNPNCLNQYWIRTAQTSTESELGFQVSKFPRLATLRKNLYNDWSNKQYFIFSKLINLLFPNLEMFTNNIR